MDENFSIILSNYRNGDQEALNELFPVIYKELRKIAHQQLGKVWAVDTICTTALVNEAYLKLIGNENLQSQDRTHFFAIAAKAMRQILINYSKQKQTAKRGADAQVTSSVEEISDDASSLEEVIAIDKALTELEVLDPNLAKLVELRFFAGMTEVEAAEVLEVSDRTVRRNWLKAKMLLAKAM